MVDKERFGERHTCPQCGCKFYDMHRTPPTCPNCGADASRPQKQVMDTAEIPPADIVDQEEEEFIDEIEDKTLEIDTDEEPPPGEEED